MQNKKQQSKVLFANDDLKPAQPESNMKGHFGRKKLFGNSVPPDVRCEYSKNKESKRKYNLSLFKIVAPKYHIATKMLSFGQDSRWKHMLINELPSKGMPVMVDIATGTGDIAQLLRKKYSHSSILGIDQSVDMMHFQKTDETFQDVSISAQDMNALAIKRESVDLVTGGYALRNAPDLSSTMDEIHRILKPEGYGAFLEFSRIPSRFLWTIEYSLLKTWGMIWGVLLHGDPSVYAYIAESLSRFPDRKELIKLFEKKGFTVLKSIRLFGGFMNISIIKKMIIPTISQ